MRPEPNFHGFIGQRKLVRQLDKLVTGARALGKVIKGFLFKGRPGLGKTLLARALALSQGIEFYALDCGPGFSVEKMLAPILRVIKAGSILFLDESHLLPPQICVWLQKCLDQKDAISVAEFLGCKAEQGDNDKKIPRFTLILATDQSAKLPDAIKSRLQKFTIGYYSQPELHDIISAYYNNYQDDDDKKIAVPCTAQAVNMIARISKGIPRTGIMHADNVWYHAKADGKTSITIDECRSYLNTADIDEETGLDDVDVAYLKALYGTDKPLSICSISCKTYADENTLRDDVEPYLMSRNYVQIVSKGRELTDKGIQTIKRILSVERARAESFDANDKT